MTNQILLEKVLQIDKSKWRLTKLGNLAEDISIRIDKPANSQYEKFVGLENFISGDIKIKTWSSTKNLTSSAKAFKKGDILFARRNAYLRRSSVVDFDGCCSGDAFVIRENLKNVVPGLLVFLMNANSLWDYANSNAAGTMSKRVKWRDLAEYEFLLPPKSEQAHLVELLWSIHEVVEKEKVLLEKLNNALNSNIEKAIHGIELNNKTIQEVINDLSNKTEVVTISALGELLKGKGIAKNEVLESGVPCVRYGEIYTKHNRVIRKYYSYINEESKNNSFKLKKNDVIFAGSGETITEIGKSAAFIDDIEAYVGSDTLVFRPFDMDGYYLGYLMNSQLVRQQLNKYGTGATVMHIYNSDLQKIKIPKINRTQQELISKNLESFTYNISEVESKIINSQSLQKSIINQIF